jgi:hypothetical protein
MLPSPPVAKTHRFHCRVWPHVVDMPVRAGRGVQVMVHSGTNAAGAKRAPDIHVETGLKAHGAKPPDPDSGICPR